MQRRKIIIIKSGKNISTSGIVLKTFLAVHDFSNVLKSIPKQNKKIKLKEKEFYEACLKIITLSCFQFKDKNHNFNVEKQKTKQKIKLTKT